MCGFFKKLFGKKKAKNEAVAEEKKVFCDCELVEDEQATEAPVEEVEVVNEASPVEETIVETPVEEEPIQEEIVEEVQEEPVQEEIVEEADAYVEPEETYVEVEENVQEEPVQEEELVEEEPIEEEVQEETVEEVEAPIEEVQEEAPVDNNVWEPVAIETPVEEEPVVEVAKPKKKAAPKKATAKKAKPVVEAAPVEEPVQEEVVENARQYVTPLVEGDKVLLEGNPAIPHGKFVIKKTDKGNFVYKLFSYNHRVVCIGGEQYKSQVTCRNGINSVMANCVDANVEDQTLRNYETQKCPKWEIYKDKQQLFRFRLIASNGQSIATTNDGYTTKDSAKRGIEAIKRASDGADIMRNDILW